jgi:hypothetical protein
VLVFILGVCLTFFLIKNKSPWAYFERHMFAKNEIVRDKETTYASIKITKKKLRHIR